jgi:hypothetical protein
MSRNGKKLNSYHPNLSIIDIAEEGKRRQTLVVFVDVCRARRYRVDVKVVKRKEFAEAVIETLIPWI